MARRGSGWVPRTQAGTPLYRRGERDEVAALQHNHVGLFWQELGGYRIIPDFPASDGLRSPGPNVQRARTADSSLTASLCFVDPSACALLGIARSGVYRVPAAAKSAGLKFPKSSPGPSFDPAAQRPHCVAGVRELELGNA